jgi:hypothetical protein
VGYIELLALFATLEYMNKAIPLHTQGSSAVVVANSAPQTSPGIFVDEVVGKGDAVTPTSTVTIHIVVQNESDQELLNTKLRGLPYSFAMESTKDEFLASLVSGMRVGGVRLWSLEAKSINSGKGIAPVIPPATNVKVKVWLLKVTSNP